MNYKTLLLPIVITAISSTGCQTNQTGNIKSSNSDGTRQINNVHWDKTGGYFKIPNIDEISENHTNIIFLRSPSLSLSNNKFVDFEDSVVVGVDDFFQVSLQPGQYSIVPTCAGNTNLSAEYTGNKNNYLKHPSLQVSLQPKQNYYFQVVTSPKGSKPIIQSISQTQALNLLNNSMQQTHQISRVIANACEVSKLPQPSPKIKPTVPSDIQINTPIQLDVLFDFDSAQIKTGYHNKINALAEFLKQNPKAVVFLASHTDSKGTSAYNLKLSQARAESVKQLLIQNYGIEAIRVTSKGFGETQPIDSNDTEQGRQNNRRVEATVSY